MIHLDTNIVVAYLRGDKRVADRIEAALPDISINAMVLAELIYGAYRSARAVENLDKVNEFVRLVPTVSFDASCAAKYGEIKAHLVTIGKPCGEVDILIAAAAVAHGAKLVTKNKRHFENIPGLGLDDWAE